MSYQSINPYDGNILKTFEELTDKQLETALETAATCFETWRQTTFAERAAVVAKSGAIMHARVDEFARPVTLGWANSSTRLGGEVVLQRGHHRLLCQERGTLPRATTPKAQFGRSRG